MNIRRCGHSDSFFFMELGRSASTGPGELWMQADDAVVAQHIHETILEAMKALRELAELRPRSKSQSSSSSSSSSSAASAASAGGGGGGGAGRLSLMCSRPISVPGPRRRHHPRPPCAALPPSQTGLLRRSRTDILAVAGGAAATVSARPRTGSESDGLKAGTLPGSPLSPDAGRTPPSRRSHLPPGRSLPLASKLAADPGAAQSQARPSGSSASSGSPNDGAAFPAFEDLGSSPAGHLRTSSSLTRTHNVHTPETPPGQHLDGSYIAMDRGHLCYWPGPCESTGKDMGPRKRTYSLTTPARQLLLPLPHSSTSLDEYTLMQATLPAAGSSSPRAASVPYPEDYCDVDIGSGGTSSSSSSHLGYSTGKEEDYMPMAPRVLSLLPLQSDPPNGYMSMSPTSLSPPGPVLRPAPSRISSESSSEDSSYMYMWGTNVRLSGDSLDGRPTSGGDYISMSPVVVPSSMNNGFGGLGPGIQSCPSHAFRNQAALLGRRRTVTSMYL
ncbi:hypothetical protein JRQ81_000480 [Phrynocephalus forsythii]|uniref:IRS-type PTB domain-containing protein n=1 Tax=Phrynocephalus forsythii TaxID=171643 RepID=A0A9Q0Y5E9_9SAUR|nr:hypothetical protein JRQ81_000480 [Phrynocephalus forsythii]